jgi:kinetochore protein NDC80
VVEFLAMRGFGRTVSHEKFLREPMTKDFFEIFKFLIAQLDPQLEVDGKIEEEVPVIMKRLRYPVEVNKSKLQSICGPNTWPQLLAVLDWLIALILVNDSLIAPVAECELGLADGDADCDTDHQMLRTLHENYIEFLSGKDDHTVEERLRQIYEERIAAMQGEVDRLQEQTAGMEAQVLDFRCEHDRLLETQAAPRQLEIEADRLRGVIQSQDARAQRAEEETISVEAEEGIFLTEIEGLDLKCRQLQEQVESQAYSKKDIERLKCERAHLRRMLEDLKTDVEKADQGVWELGIEESRLEESISRTVRSVNDKAEVVEGDVTAVDGPSGQELVAHVDLTEPTDALAALDWSELSSRVEVAAEAHNEAMRQEEAGAHEVFDEQRQVQEELSQKDREVRRLKVRVDEFTRMREEYRVWSDAELDDARRTAEATEDAVRAAELGTAAPTLRDTAEVDELRLLLSEMLSNREADRAVMEDKIRREQEARELHQENVQKEMQFALETMDQLREDVEKRVAELGGA